MNDQLSDAALELLASDAVATVVTLDADGTPHLSAAWVGIEDGEIVIGTLDDQRKLQNLRRDPRVALTIQSEHINDWGLREYLVINGTARITEGGAAALLQRLARTYIGPDVVFPGMPDPPPACRGWVPGGGSAAEISPSARRSRWTGASRPSPGPRSAARPSSARSR
jgi:PPOX class probable F420-dependent enzyme